MIGEIIGKLHPLLVHLPIGIISLAILLRIISNYQFKTQIIDLLPLILRIGFISCLFTSITGYVLHLSGDYDDTLVHNHLYSGVIFTILIGILCIKGISPGLEKLFWFLIGLSMVVVGHLGGSLTHGETYFSFDAKKAKKEQVKVIDLNSSKAYTDVIVPILEAKCYSCHGDKKQKGKLRLDNYKNILKGGESGPALASNVSESEMIKRILLPLHHDEHMPPKGKPQVTDSELKLMKWWINKGSSETATIAQLQPEPEILKILKTYQTSPSKTQTTPLPPIDLADQKVIEKLVSLGIVISPLSQKDNHLLVNVSFTEAKAKQYENELQALKNHIVIFKAVGKNINDDQISLIENMENLRELHLREAKVTDKIFSAINKLNKLETLNLAHTTITEQGVKNLNLPNLKALYLHGIKVNVDINKEVQNKHPMAKIDTGGVQLLIIQADTIIKKSK